MSGKQFQQNYSIHQLYFNFTSIVIRSVATSVMVKVTKVLSVAASSGEKVDSGLLTSDAEAAITNAISTVYIIDNKLPKNLIDALFK